MGYLKDRITDYCGSEQFFFLEDELKAHAEQLLDFFSHGEDSLSIQGILTGLSAVSRSGLPVEARRSFPRVLKAYVEYLEGSGHISDAEEWTDFIDASEDDFVLSIREDGTVKGQTVRNRHTAVGRNEPCPCGSGKKFKKCCGR